MSDPRMTWTPGALSHDHGGRIYKGRPSEPLSTPSGVRWSPVMRAATFEILAQPVTVREENPAAVSGEIEVRT